MFFIETRDKICQKGELLLTPALSYTEKHLQTSLETEKLEKQPKDQQQTPDDKKSKEQTDDKQMVGYFLISVIDKQYFLIDTYIPSAKAFIK